MADSCPSLDRLEDWVAGQIVDAELSAHVSACPNCSAVAGRIRADNSLLGHLASLEPVTSHLPFAQPDPDPQTGAGTSMDAYRIIGEVHHGGQGVVYEAIHNASKRRVALKMPLPGKRLSAAAKRRFERETELVASLRHPNIVTLYDSGLGAAGSDRRPYLVMEFVDGLPIDRFVRENLLRAPETVPPKSDDLKSALRLLLDVCAAVQHAHQRGVIHRDLKPGNVFVDTEGRVRVLDFGLAKALDPMAEGQAVTRTAEFVGTLSYAAPEQVSGDPQQIDTRTDVYALGVVLYELLTGRLPYAAAGSLSDVVRTITTVEPRPPRSLCAWMDDELETMVLKALAKDRERRYRSVGSLGDDLQRYLAGEAIDAKRDSTWYVLRKSARRYRVGLAVTAIIALAMLVGIGSLTYGMATSKNAALRVKSASLQRDYERAKAASEATKSEVVVQILNELLPPDHAVFRWDDTSRSPLDRWLESGQFANRPEVEAAIRRTLGALQLDRQSLAMSESEYRHALRLRLMAFGEDHPDSAQSYNDLAELLLVRHALPEAERRARQSLDIRNKLQGRNHVDVAQSLDTLARIRLARDDVPAAEQLGKEALAIRQDSLADPHLDIAASWATVAKVKLAQRQFAGAEDAAKRALSMHLALLSDRQPRIPSSLELLAQALDDGSAVTGAPAIRLTTSPARLRDLADTLRATDWSGDSERACLGLLAIKEELLGPNHSEVAESLVNLGETLRRSDRHKEAVAAISRALDIYVATFGDNHLVTADCMQQLATAIDAAEGIGSQATVSLLERRYRIFDRLLAGKDDRLVGVVEKELGSAYRFAGDYRQAESHFLHVIEHYEETLGPTNLQLADAILQLAELFRLQERFNEIEPWARRGIAVLEENRVTGIFHYGYLHGLIGIALLKQDRAEQAEHMLQIADEMIVRVVDNPSDVSVMLIQKSLAEARRTLNRPGMAE